MIAGLAMLSVGGALASDAASAIARFLGMSERVVGLTVVSLGTDPLKDYCTDQGNSLATVNEYHRLFTEELKDQTGAFRELLAQRTNRPNFERLSADIAEMQSEVSAAAEKWYQRARELKPQGK